MALTRFKDYRAGYDGPVSGALVPITVNFSPGVAGGTTDKYKIDLPPGCRVRVVDASFRASTVAGSPSLSVGTVANSTALVAATTVTTNLGTLTLKTASRHLVQDSMLIAALTVNGATNTCRGGVLTLIAHVSAPPDSVLVRTGNRTHF